MGKKPSYVWHSIMVARETVERGSRWCIGNGRAVEIWHDSWIPTPENFKVISPKGSDGELEKVAQLIDGETGMWKADLIKKTFLPHEAKIILGISLSPRLPKDSQIWAWLKNDNFAVRSAYGMALKVLKEATLVKECRVFLEKEKSAGLWKLVWKLNYPNKIKHFL